tara:strand:- start:13819 stop:14682 length:864 start_codon:yes stop_codon:yes gene_type:complete
MQEIVSVDILIANYNNSEYLDSFFESIAKSTKLPKNIIFVDDCSIDDSVLKVKKTVIRNVNIKLIKLNKNIGFANALNEGLKFIDSEYVLRIDPDDILHPERIESQLKEFRKNPILDIVGSNVVYFKDVIQNVMGKSNFPIDHNDIKTQYINGNHGLCHGALMIKSNCFLDNKYKQESFPAEEYDIFSRMINSGKLTLNLPENLTYVRIHHESVSNEMPISTVIKTFKLREKHFDIKTSKTKIKIEHVRRKYYRKFLYTDYKYRYLLLLVVIILSPSRLIKRLKKKN